MTAPAKRLALEGFTMLPVGLYIGLYPLFKYYLKKYPERGEQWYSLVFKSVYKLGERPLREMKDILFADLHQQVSIDVKYLSERSLRILEVGPGFGGNFKYYPGNTELTTIEIKPFLESKLDDLKKKYPNVSYVKSVIGNAENMTQIESESFDVVVGTLIMCCIEKPREALKEIQRVLAKVSFISFNNFTL